MVYLFSSLLLIPDDHADWVDKALLVEARLFEIYSAKIKKSGIIYLL